MTRFVLLFEGRTGSTHLISHLQSHPQIRAEYESLAELKRVGVDAQVGYLRALYAAAPTTNPAAVGLKSKLRDLADRAVFAELFRKEGARVLHMTRENRIKQVVSALNGVRLWEARRQWNIEDEGERLPPVRFDPPVFHATLERREQQERELAAYVADLGLPSLRVTYEGLLLDEPATLAAIFAFLGVDLLPTRSVYVKNTTDDLRQAILNFDELKAAFAGTPYEPMFDEVLTGR